MGKQKASSCHASPNGTDAADDARIQRKNRFLQTRTAPLPPEDGSGGGGRSSARAAEIFAGDGAVSKPNPRFAAASRAEWPCATAIAVSQVSAAVPACGAWPQRA
ncbi:hypothetical protein CVO74_10235 [Xanthomonas prunicola]|uniref:Uncharacterized protein n=1 Tax=Xanthomonas prunicola TaxID=2053930 RepID=A0A2N3RL69_9XANT|nr:hypothetical protein XpruCFBP8353_08185 [Xanthomonas prunicola]PKV17500.1 hypothetical protein XpruCFBP8354_08180 [Xanthomonas prunicola]PKV21396.1 hypothetical protein CVO74_10235 [Xanthomonas prunicola]